MLNTARIKMFASRFGRNRLRLQVHLLFRIDTTSTKITRSIIQGGKDRLTFNNNSQQAYKCTFLITSISQSMCNLKIPSVHRFNLLNVSEN